MIRYMDALRRLRGVQGWEFEIHHVKGHASSTGNIAADRLANEGCVLPLDEAEPNWDARTEEVDTRIGQIVRDKVHKKGQPVEMHTTVKKDDAEATLVAGPRKALTVAPEDDFSVRLRALRVVSRLTLTLCRTSIFSITMNCLKNWRTLDLSSSNPGDRFYDTLRKPYIADISLVIRTIRGTLMPTGDQPNQGL